MRAMSGTADWLVSQGFEDLLVLDCRSPGDYHAGHIRGALNVPLPASVIMLRRLASGSLPVTTVIRDPSSKDRFVQQAKTHVTVLYDDKSDSKVVSTLQKRLQQDGYQAVCLQDGFSEFHAQYPEWCESEGDLVQPPVLGLESLRITSLPESPSSKLDSGLDVSPDDPPFPVEILPHLFLGNADNSTDLEALTRHRIRYILNVTPNLPNVFEGADQGFRYLQIPILDHWSQNLAAFFPNAIAFIDEARQKKQGVLVHCLAGVSRSVTVTLAYLMHKLQMSLNDAYDLVRHRKANISPNLNFMSQLMDFERQLQPCVCNDSSSCTCRHTTTRATPDSGIDLDHWT